MEGGVNSWDHTAGRKMEKQGKLKQLNKQTNKIYDTTFRHSISGGAGQ